VGGSGKDSETGGAGPDILIGGAGADILHAGSGGDILIAGRTNYDSHLSALLALMAEWGSGNPYQTRVNHLFGNTSGGLNGTALLNTQAIVTDNVADQLFGGAGTDWFWLTAGTDTLSGESAGEVVSLK
jgi:hypothetical protein